MQDGLAALSGSLLDTRISRGFRDTVTIPMLIPLLFGLLVGCWVGHLATAKDSAIDMHGTPSVTRRVHKPGLPIRAAFGRTTGGHPLIPRPMEFGFWSVGHSSHVPPPSAEPRITAWTLPEKIGPNAKGAVATEEQLATLLPTLYVYDHCPFCVRARMIFGIKKISYNLVFLQNDDIITPNRLIGKKLTPILEDRANNVVMPESLDIVKYVDEQSNPLLKPSTDREDLKAWAKMLGGVRSKLTRPRFGQSLFAEFGTRNAATAYVNNHPFDDGTSYEDALAKTGDYIQVVNEAMLELEPMIHGPESISPGGVSYDDITTFPLLRSLTIVKGITWPPKVLSYMENMSRIADVPMLWQLAF